MRGAKVASRFDFNKHYQAHSHSRRTAGIEAQGFSYKPSFLPLAQTGRPKFAVQLAVQIWAFIFNLHSGFRECQQTIDDFQTEFYERLSSELAEWPHEAGHRGNLAHRCRLRKAVRECATGRAADARLCTCCLGDEFPRHVVGYRGP